MGGFPEKKGPNSCCFQKHWRFFTSTIPSSEWFQNLVWKSLLWALRKSRFQATGLGTQTLQSFPTSLGQQCKSDHNRLRSVCCHPAFPPQARKVGANKSHSSLHAGRTHFFLGLHHTVNRLLKSPDSHSRPVPLCEPGKHWAGGSSGGQLESRTKSHGSCVYS